jgi:hypothetical protein
MLLVLVLVVLVDTCSQSVKTRRLVSELRLLEWMVMHGLRDAREKTRGQIFSNRGWSGRKREEA